MIYGCAENIKKILMQPDEFKRVTFALLFETNMHVFQVIAPF